MGLELKMLVWAIAFGLAQIALFAMLSTQQRGLAWNAGPRDGTPKPLTGMGARVERSLHNFVETFAFFAAAVLAVLLAQKTSEHTALGAQLYFWARVAYLPLYAFGIAYLRTAAWGVSVAGILMVLLALF
jgi:uncharacterized MAPEG superfamily protein